MDAISSTRTNVDESMTASKESESPTSNGYAGEKRKADDGGEQNAGGSGQTHTRSKRNRYISIACNECKRRKIKCNGQTPCMRCGNLNLECIYAPNCCTSSVKDSEEFQHMRDQITSLQDQVNDLYANLNELRSRQDGFSAPSSEAIYSHDNTGRSISISMSRTLPPLGPSPVRAPPKVLPPFHGPTSSTYGFDVAKSTLQTMGITQAGNQDDGLVSRDRSANASPFPSVVPNGGLQGPPHPSKDPLWLIEQSEAIRLCRVYNEEIGIMYPYIDMDKIIKHLNLLYTFIGAALRTGFGQPTLLGADAIEDDDTIVLKLVLAITLVLEGNGKSELGQRFFDSTRQAVNLKIVGALDVVAVHLVILTATYHFHKDEEAQAWRFIGIAARLCIEMGLHRKDSLVKTFTNEAEYQAAIRTFWVVYALDRRWSFGTGMPFALQDGDIDHFLPEPDDTYPYLKHITKYNQIAAKIWYNNLAYEGGDNGKQDQVGFLDYQVLQWYNQLPESLKFNSKDLPAEMEVPGRGMRRLRFLMHLRKNQARISIYRPVLHSATSIMENRNHAQTVINVAKDQIQTITGVNHISDLYRTQQVCYNYFLVQALAVIFLAVSHAPAEFCRQTREEFYAAIEFIRGFNAKSFVARRLWKTVRGLKEMGDKIGLLARGGLNETEQGEQERAAVAMAGLAGHRVDGRERSLGNGVGLTPGCGLNGWSGGTGLRNNSIGYSPEDGAQIGNELSSLFELAGGYGGGMGSPSMGNDGYGQYSGQVLANGEITDGREGVSAIFGNEQEFSRIMGELF